ncbi:MAG: glycosyltransferase family 4 protein [Candidatus Hodarchaeota archaeon]
MPLRVCITGLGESKSIGGLSEDEFHHRISKASGGQIQVTFVNNKGRYHRNDSNVARPWENREPLGWLFSYPSVCLRNLSNLIRQDILVTDSIAMAGVIVCLFSRLFKKKSMITIHGHYEEERLKKPLSPVRNILFATGSKFILRFASTFVTNDEQIAQKLVRKGVQSSRVSVRYVFADTKKFSRVWVTEDGFQEFISHFRLPEKYALYVGDLTYWDGAQDMVEIIKRIHSRLPAVKFVLIGEGSLKSWISQFIRESNLNGLVFQIDNLDHKLMPFAYYGADVLICPLHPPQAGVGRITLEGLSMELPVIAYDIGELHHVVKDKETGYLVPEGDTDLMAEKTVSLLMTRDLKIKLGRNGRKLVQYDYDIDTYIGNWLQSLYSLGSI